MASRFLRLSRQCLHHDDAGDNLKTIGDPVLDFVKQHAFLAQQDILFAQISLNGNILYAEHDIRVRFPVANDAGI